MTRYEILLGIAPPPEPPPPPDYVMGVDLSHRGETTCCICHREDDDCIHIDSIYRIPDHPPDRPLAELRHQWGLMAPDVMMDRDMKNGKWKEARERAVFGRYQYSDDIKSMNRTSQSIWMMCLRVIENSISKDWTINTKTG